MVYAQSGHLAERHAGTIMAGRTWLQQAVPVTFGWKAAGWLDALLRHRSRLRELREHAPTLQFGGAAGTLASLGENGGEVSEKLAKLLGLAHPDISWHTSRDRVAEIATTLGLVTASLGKIARDISLLMQTEVGEAFESADVGRGASSTMPQKRNPVACAAILGGGGPSARAGRHRAYRHGAGARARAGQLAGGMGDAAGDIQPLRRGA